MSESMGVRELLGLTYEPTPEQMSIITHPLFMNGVPAPLLVVAGAGSGKTETMSVRAAFLGATKAVLPHEILGLTFTRKAAAELDERLSIRSFDERVALDLGTGPLATTYNSFALSVVQEFGPLVGVSPDMAHMDAAASWQLMHQIVTEWTGELPDKSVMSIADDALSLRDDMAGQGMDLDATRAELAKLQRNFDMALADRKSGKSFWEKGASVNKARQLLLDVIAEFDRRKAELGRTDFADQVLIATQVIKEVPRARQTLRERHKVVFLDEFQDTSVAQMEFLSLLFHDHPVTAVGDPNQAIYGWRGASAASLDDFHRLFTTDDEAEKIVLSLSTSWRNGSQILAGANITAGPLRELVGQRGVSSPILKAAPGAAKGALTGAYVRSEEEQIQSVVDFVRQSREELDGNPPTVAVLCRRTAMIEPILDALRATGIPAETTSAQGLLFHPAVVDVKEAIRLASDIGASPSAVRLLVRAGLGTKDLWQLGRLASKIAREKGGENDRVPLLVEAMNRADEAGLSVQGLSRVTRLTKQVRQIAVASSWSIVDQIANARQVLGIEREALVTGQYQQVFEVLDALADAAASYQSSALSPSIGDFLAWLDVAEKKERGLQLPTVQPDPEAVQVMTVHASKGLEWDAVAVVDLELAAFPNKRRGAGSRTVKGEIVSPLNDSGVLPQSGWWATVGALPYPSRRDSEHLPCPQVWRSDLKMKEAKDLFEDAVGEYLQSEERRLAYVAFTRPRFRLGLFGSWMGTSVKPRFPSVFLTELASLTGVTVDEESMPAQEEIDQIHEHAFEAVFPPPATKIQKELQMSAHLVRAEMENSALTDSSSLAELPSGLRETLLVQLAELSESQAKAHWTPEQRAEEDVRQASLGKNWSLRVTQIATLAEENGTWMNLRRPVPDEPIGGSGLGTAFHQWVEQRFRTVSAGVRTEEPDTAQFASRLSDKEAADFDEMRRRFADISWKDKVDPVALETPFAVEVSGLLVRGRIDAVLWHEESGEEWLIDWKTGSFPSRKWDKEQLTGYLAQLSAYDMAWKRGSKQKVKAKLVFLGGTKAREVSLEDLAAAYKELTGEEWIFEDYIGGLSKRLRWQLT